MYSVFKRIFGALIRRHPKLAPFDSLTEEERRDLIAYEAEEFSRRYGSVIKALAKE